MDFQNFHATFMIRDPNVNLPIKSSITTQSGINGVRTVCGRHHKNAGTRFHTIHQSKELGNHPFVNLTYRLIPPGGHAVNLINENNGGGIVLGLLENLPKIGLGFSGHLGHHFRTIDGEKEGTGFVGNRLGN